jgi:hypothetical protein
MACADSRFSGWNFAAEVCVFIPSMLPAGFAPRRRGDWAGVGVDVGIGGRWRQELRGSFGDWRHDRAAHRADRARAVRTGASGSAIGLAMVRVRVVEHGDHWLRTTPRHVRPLPTSYARPAVAFFMPDFHRRALMLAGGHVWGGLVAAPTISTPPGRG